MTQDELKNKIHQVKLNAWELCSTLSGSRIETVRAAGYSSYGHACESIIDKSRLEIKRMIDAWEKANPD
jgi:hypothetical protein